MEAEISVTEGLKSFLATTKNGRACLDFAEQTLWWNDSKLASVTSVPFVLAKIQGVVRSINLQGVALQMVMSFCDVGDTLHISASGKAEAVVCRLNSTVVYVFESDEEVFQAPFVDAIEPLATLSAEAFITMFTQEAVMRIFLDNNQVSFETQKGIVCCAAANASTKEKKIQVNVSYFMPFLHSVKPTTQKVVLGVGPTGYLHMKPEVSLDDQMSELSLVASGEQKKSQVWVVPFIGDD
jgi:hypothetical protein